MPHSSHTPSPLHKHLLRPLPTFLHHSLCPCSSDGGSLRASPSESHTVCFTRRTNERGSFPGKQPTLWDTPRLVRRHLPSSRVRAPAHPPLPTSPIPRPASLPPGGLGELAHMGPSIFPDAQPNFAASSTPTHPRLNVSASPLNSAPSEGRSGHPPILAPAPGPAHHPLSRPPHSLLGVLPASRCAPLPQKPVGLPKPLAPGLPSQHPQCQEVPRPPRDPEHRRRTPASGPLRLLSPLPGMCHPVFPSPAALLSEALPPAAPSPPDFPPVYPGPSHFS